MFLYSGNFSLHNYIVYFLESVRLIPGQTGHYLNSFIEYQLQIRKNPPTVLRFVIVSSL